MIGCVRIDVARIERTETLSLEKHDDPANRYCLGIDCWGALRRCGDATVILIRFRLCAPGRAQSIAPRRARSENCCARRSMRRGRRRLREAGGKFASVGSAFGGMRAWGVRPLPAADATIGAVAGARWVRFPEADGCERQLGVKAVLTGESSAIDRQPAATGPTADT
jgi:hypothetical protein